MKYSKRRVKELVDELDENQILIDDVVKSLVNQHIKPADDLINDIKNKLNSDKDLCEEDLHKLIMDIPVIGYYLTEASKDLGLKEDLSYYVKKEVYNKSHLAACGTVEARKAEAELDSLYDSITQSACARANKLLKDKIDFLYSLLNSAKAILKSKNISKELARVGKERIEE